MIYSNDRKLCLSGYLQLSNPSAYAVPLKLQKFLFLYESFSKTYNSNPDFSHLKGYVRGPVFSTVWGDYTKERTEFNEAAVKCFQKGNVPFNNNWAEKCSFIVSTLSEKDLSDLTHRMNIWNSKRDRIMRGEKQVSLEEQDFNDQDKQMIRTLDSMYPITMIRNSVCVSVDNNYFLFTLKDYVKLTEEHMDILSYLSYNEDLHNPVYVEIDENGGLSID